MPASQDGAEFARAWERDRVTDEVHTSIPAMQRPAFHTAPYLAPADGGNVQLMGRDQRELLVRDPLHRDLPTPARVHKSPNLANRNDLGNISARVALMLPGRRRAGGFAAFCTRVGGHSGQGCATDGRPPPKRRD